MKSILVATDFSAPAANAVDYAAHLAQVMNAELMLFNVFKVTSHISNSLGSTEIIANMIKKNEDKLTQMAEDLNNKLGISVGWEIRRDETVECLKKYTDNHPVDLVVMGIENNLAEYRFFGNTTTSAIKLMKFPLLVVPDNFGYTAIEKIMYAWDPEYVKDDCRLDVLKQFVKQLNAHLKVFHVFTDSDKTNKEVNEQEMNEILEGVDHSFSYTDNSKVDNGIEEGLSQYPSDLLIMVPHKLKFFESLFKGSNTSQMTVKTRIPLLVIPNEISC